jgi:Ferritin-like domain.
MNSELKETMNGLVADFAVLYMKLHHFHWYVKGSNFFTLHAKFEELYNEVTGYMDDVAERLLTVGEKPVSTMKQFLELSTVKETEAVGTETEMVEAVINDFKTVDERLKKGIQLSADEGDDPTNDMLIGISSSLEKHIWMLRSYLGK